MGNTIHAQAAAAWVTLPCSAVLQGQAAPVKEQGPSLHRSPMGSQSPLRHPLLQGGALHRLQADPCIPVDLHGLQGHSCFTMAIMGCRRIPALVPGAPPALPSALTLLSAELFLHVLAPSFSSHNFNSFSFIFLKYAFSEVLPLFLIGPALASGTSVFGTARDWLCWSWRELPATSGRSHPCSPSLPAPPKPRPCKLNTAGNRDQVIISGPASSSCCESSTSFLSLTK